MEELNIVFGIAAIPTIYLGGLVGFGIAENFCSEKIKSKEDLERITSEEAKKLDLDQSNLFPVFIQMYSKGHKLLSSNRASVRGYDKKKHRLVPYGEVDEQNIFPIQVIEIKEGFGSSRGMVRHELYHLKKHLSGAKSKFFNRLKWFYEEPAATIYAVTGLQI